MLHQTWNSVPPIFEPVFRHTAAGNRGFLPAARQRENSNSLSESQTLPLSRLVALVFMMLSGKKNDLTRWAKSLTLCVILSKLDGVRVGIPRR